MSLTFLIPVAIFLIAGYIFKNSSDEISYLAAAISLISFFFSLVLAPWPIQLLLLVLIVFSGRGQSVPSEDVVESQEEEKIKLLYRGANYEPPSPTSEVTEVEIKGKYRGQIWKNRQLLSDSRR
jgi:predicted membrane protein